MRSASYCVMTFGNDCVRYLRVGVDYVYVFVTAVFVCDLTRCTHDEITGKPYSIARISKPIHRISVLAD